MKKTMVRIISMVLLLVMALGLFPVSAFAAQDSTPPVLRNVTLSATTVNAPGQVEIIVDATDDVSGVYYGHVEFYSEESDRGFGTELEAAYWDNTQGTMVPYADGKLHGFLYLDEYLPAGTYQLVYVGLGDRAGNHYDYDRYAKEQDSNYGPLPEALKSIQLLVRNSNPQDSTPPVLKNVTLSATTVNAPGQVEIIVDTTDDVSGAHYGHVEFYCEEVGRSYGTELMSMYWDQEQQKEVPYPDGKLHGTLYFGEYTPAGTYQLVHVGLGDRAGNHYDYDRYAKEQDSNYGPLPEALKSIQLLVRNSNPQDSTPPVLKNVTLSATTVNAPGQVEIIVEATDDVSGVYYGHVEFYSEESDIGFGTELEAAYWDNAQGTMVPYADGKLHGFLYLDEYLPAGTYQLVHVGLGDRAGNHYDYDRYAKEQDSNYGPLPEAVKNIQLTVRNGSADGWTQEGGKWVYYRGGVKLKSQWLQDGSNWFYLKSDGTMATGWTQVGGHWYYMNKSGVMQTGWVQDGGSWYFLNSSGTMATGWVQSGGKWYYMNKSGVMQTGWVQDGGKWYYMNAKGNMMTGWLQVGKNWYYLSSKGVMQTGWVSDGKYWYFMNAKGVMQTGWLKDGNYWYYLNKSGVMHTGWLKDGNYWYYMNKSGVMVTGTQVINGKTYVFNSSGVWIG